MNVKKTEKQIKEVEVVTENYYQCDKCNEEIEEDYDLQDCPSCGSDAVGYDGTGSVPFLECFECEHNWTPTRR